MLRLRSTVAIASILALGACAVAPPSGPRVMALPGPGKDFATFQAEDMQCRNYASSLTGGTAGAQQATNAAVGTAVAGTAIGAGVGAALGSLSGQMGAGAAVGGAMGALVGGSQGANVAAAGAGDLQQRYDTGYTQCMYSYQNTVQSPPGGYRGGYAGYGYPGYGYGYGYAAPAVVVAPEIGFGWGWGGGWRHRYWH